MKRLLFLSLLFLPVMSFAAPPYFDNSNQPVYNSKITTENPHGGINYMLYTSGETHPIGFDCGAGQKTFGCRNTDFTGTAGDNLMKIFLSGNNTTRLRPGFYTWIHMVNLNCSSNDSTRDDCAAGNAGFVQTFIIKPYFTTSSTGLALDDVSANTYDYIGVLLKKFWPFLLGAAIFVGLDVISFLIVNRIFSL